MGPVSGGSASCGVGPASSGPKETWPQPPTASATPIATNLRGIGQILAKAMPRLNTGSTHFYGDGGGGMTLHWILTGLRPPPPDRSRCGRTFREHTFLPPPPAERRKSPPSWLEPRRHSHGLLRPAAR